MKYTQEQKDDLKRLGLDRFTKYTDKSKPEPMKQESKIQQEIFIYWHNTHPETIIHSVPNGFGFTIPEIIPIRFHAAIRKAIAMAVNFSKQTGMIEGISDLIIHLPGGRAVMVEVKNEKNIQSPAQKKIEAKIKAMGGNYILVRSLEDFKEQIQAFL